MADAQLSALLVAAATNPAYAGVLGLEPAFDADRLRWVILTCGLYEVPAMTGSGGVAGWGVRQALWAYTGKRDYAASRAGAEISVLRWVTADFPPTWISGGNDDPLTRT